ncbi:MAG: hypothetical protein ACFCU3_02090 [Verrucomicrobiales bacterium]
METKQPQDDPQQHARVEMSAPSWSAIFTLALALVVFAGVAWTLHHDRQSRKELESVEITWYAAGFEDAPRTLEAPVND